VYRSTILVLQYCKCTILVHPVLYIYDTGFRYCNITILVFLVLYSVTNTGISSIVNIIILVIPVFVTAASYYPLFFANKIIELRSIINMTFIQKGHAGGIIPSWTALVHICNFLHFIKLGCLSMLSVSITTNITSLNPANDEVYSFRYVI
jgi:hypothetical protein